MLLRARTDPDTKAGGGTVGYFGDGGSVTDGYARGIDRYSIEAAKDEFIVNPQASRRFKSQLTAINNGVDPGSGGSRGDTNVGDIHVHVQGGETSQQTIREIAAGIKREIRRGTISF